VEYKKTKLWTFINNPFKQKKTTPSLYYAMLCIFCWFLRFFFVFFGYPTAKKTSPKLTASCAQRSTGHLLLHLGMPIRVVTQGSGDVLPHLRGQALQGLPVGFGSRWFWVVPFFSLYFGSKKTHHKTKKKQKRLALKKNPMNHSYKIHISYFLAGERSDTIFTVKNIPLKKPRDVFNAMTMKYEAQKRPGHELNSTSDFLSMDQDTRNRP